MNSLVTIVIVLMFLIKGFKYRKSSVLCCGQFGYIGDNYDPTKIAILGLYNQTRGVHSCGVFVNDFIMKGIDKQKMWMDFIAENPLPENLTSGNNVIMGHCRQASSGIKHGWEEQHPFHIGNKVGQQNGTIKNTAQLQEKYKIAYKDWDVDTQLLYMIMDKYGYDVLEEYTGWAALMWAHADTQNELYVFRGAHQSEHNDIRYYEERPLFYLKEENGYYFSSMENALKYIRTNPEHMISVVPHNKVIRLYFDDEGIVRFHTIKKINRDGSNFLKATYWNNNQGNGNTRVHHTGGTGQNNTMQRAGATQNGSKEAGTDGNKLKKHSRAHEFSTRTVATDRCLGRGIIFNFGRFMDGDGRFLHGIASISENGLICKKEKAHDTYYFFAGVMFRNREEYMKFTREPFKEKNITVKKSKHYFKRYAFEPFKESPGWVIEMSNWSKYPLKVMEYNCLNKAYEEKWLYKGMPADQLVASPEFSNFRYSYFDGDLIERKNLGRINNPNGTHEVIDVLKLCGIKLGEEDDADSCGTDCSGIEAMAAETVKDSEEGDRNGGNESIWDMKVSSMARFLSDATQPEMVVMHFYVKEILSLDSNKEPLPDQIKSQLYYFIGRAVINKTTMREIIEQDEIGSLELFGNVLYDADSNDTVHYKSPLVRKLYNSDMVKASVEANNDDDNMEPDDEIFQDVEIINHLSKNSIVNTHVPIVRPLVLTGENKLQQDIENFAKSQNVGIIKVN